ncbi:MAG: MmgE/PrpD family protein [Burkholderiales bacterium]|nr:MmgE/PrpD family protein [Burkholderiales bacterium]
MLVNEFGKFIAQTGYESLPAAVVATVKLRVLDLLAAGLAGYKMGCHKQLLPILGGAPEATVWGVGNKLALRDAILANSFMSHALYIEDGSRFTGGHPSPVVMPAAIALAETQRSSGKDLIAAVAAGYEVFLRLGRAIYPSTVVRGFQSTAVLGAAASAAACASLLHYTSAHAKNAIAIACSLGVGLKEALKSSGSQPIQVARSCEGGLMAALFAGQGAEGADSILEAGFLKAFAEDPPTDAILSGLGRDFRIFETYIKVHGGCRGNHAPVDVVQDVIRNNAIAPESIASIAIRVDSVTYAAEIHAPKSGNEAQFSVAFAVAAAVVKGDASIFRYTDATLADPDVRAMMAKVTVEVDRELDKGYPENRAAGAQIVLTDARRYSGTIPNAKGEPEAPFSAADIESKFLTLAEDILPGGGGRVHELVMGLERLPDVGVVAAALKAKD